jgi:hypothetical protein
MSLGEKWKMHRLQKHLDFIRARSRAALAPPALIISDRFHICGLIRAREIPFETEAEWRQWWLCERDLSGKILRAARMSDREKDRYTVAQSANILVSGGITQVLNYVGSGSGNATGFAQYFAVGNIGINQVTSADTSVAGEYFRAVPSTASVSGTQQDISVFAGTSQANGTITNAGLFGAGATSTIGSGTMVTHSLLQYSKTNANAITFDYLLSYV